MNQTLRLDNLLSEHGFCSRRKAAQFIIANKVTINGNPARQPGERVNLQQDQLLVNGKKLELLTDQKELVYYAVNKPKGVLSTASNNAKRKTIMSLIPNKIRVYPVGRLDEQSTGLVLITNDGDLAHKLTDPKLHISKTYLVWIVGKPSEKRLDYIRQGMKLKEGWIKPTKVTVLKNSPKRTLVEVALNEEKSHQLRSMFSKVGINIVELKRIKIASLQLQHLGLSQYRELTEKEVILLKQEIEQQLIVSN